MNPTLKQSPLVRGLPFVRAAGALLLAAAWAMPLTAQAQAPFAKPDQAADALIGAMAGNDPVALSHVLGKDWRTLINPETVDRDSWYAFLEKSAQSRVLNQKDGRATLSVGKDPWTLPIPIVQGKDGQWRFDPVAGRDELAVRRIGANELAAMQAVLAYVDAQREYAQVDRIGNGALEYAQKLVSSPGKRDGLIWPVSLGDDSPLGEAYLPKQPGAGYHGYHYRILTGQGNQAKGGARSYLIGKRMVNGFALLAWPVRYGSTGVMSFIVNQDGQLYERNLGPQTQQAAAAIQLFNPEEGWKPVKP